MKNAAMNVLKAIDVIVVGFLDWVYSLPPDSLKEYEIALAAYLVSIHLIDPADQAMWVALGFGAYGIIKAIREVSVARVPVVVPTTTITSP